MELKNTPERRALDAILHSEDWTALAQFGIRDLKRPPSTSDCGHYILELIGVPANPAMIETLQQLEMNGTQPKEGIIFYREWGAYGWRTMHYGHVSGDKVRSKWGPTSPILEHDLELVPAYYGNHVLFCSMKRARSVFLERQQQTMFGPENY